VIRIIGFTSASPICAGARSAEWIWLFHCSSDRIAGCLCPKVDTARTRPASDRLGEQIFDYRIDLAL
jgi:hypothetical protein